MKYSKKLKMLFTKLKVHSDIMRASQIRLNLTACFVNVWLVPELNKKWRNPISGGIAMKNMKKAIANYVECMEAAMASYMEYVSRVRHWSFYLGGIWYEKLCEGYNQVHGRICCIHWSCWSIKQLNENCYFRPGESSPEMAAFFIPQI